MRDPFPILKSSHSSSVFEFWGSTGAIKFVSFHDLCKSLDFALSVKYWSFCRVPQCARVIWNALDVADSSALWGLDAHLFTVTEI